MSKMETIPELQVQVQHLADDSDMSDSSYQTDGFPGTRQSSINTEPLTLDSDEIETAKGEAEHVLESVGPEEAFHIFTKDLDVNNGQATTEEEMVSKIVNDHSRVKDGGGAMTEEEIAKKVADHFDNIVQKAAEIVDANEKLSQATSKPPGAPQEQASGGE